MGGAGLGRGRRLGQGEDGGAEGLDALALQFAEGAEAVDGAGDLEDDPVRQAGEDLSDAEQLFGGVAVDLHHHRFVGDVQVALGDVHDLTIFLDHLVQHHRVGDDARRSQRQPFLQVRGIARQPDGGAGSGGSFLGAESRIVAFLCHVILLRRFCIVVSSDGA